MNFPMQQIDHVKASFTLDSFFHSRYPFLLYHGHVGEGGGMESVMLA